MCAEGSLSLSAVIEVFPQAELGGSTMSDALTDSQIALLCEIGELHLRKLSSDQQRDLEQLIAGGYVRAAEGDAATAAFTPTAKGIDFLGKRGAGLNEA
jgi:hypothetical protein